ncbi:hypothetical protein EV359DRAFT_78453 [Lentinula novae-zelandiae]|nr:hypothetical protein EV359DRAFT_78453 [Lentinula novae-zelandiae]
MVRQRGLFYFSCTALSSSGLVREKEMSRYDPRRLEAEATEILAWIPRAASKRILLAVCPSWTPPAFYGLEVVFTLSRTQINKYTEAVPVQLFSISLTVASTSKTSICQVDFTIALNLSPLFRKGYGDKEILTSSIEFCTASLGMISVCAPETVLSQQTGL